MTTEIGFTLADLQQRIETRQASVGIVGMGYVGLPLALLFSDEHFRVTGFDIAFPENQTEERYLPGPQRVKAAIEAVLQYEF